MVQMKVKLPVNEIAQLENRMKSLELRGKIPSVVSRAMKDAGKPTLRMARNLTPKPGYPGDKPGFTPLRNTWRTFVRKYDYVWYAVMGTKWPEGAHGHLVEDGHRIVTSSHSRRKGARDGGQGLTPTGARSSALKILEWAWNANRAGLEKRLAAAIVKFMNKVLGE